MKSMHAEARKLLDEVGLEVDTLTETETDILFGIIRKLGEKGVAIVFISHKLAEIFAITDEVAILRDGVSAGRMVTEGCTENDIIKAMVGRDVDDLYPKQNAAIGDVILEVDSYWQMLIMGVVIIGAVTLDQLRHAKK